MIGETQKEVRDHIIGKFRAGEITCLVNVGVLTEGFDSPGTDLICMLRPTLSTGLYVQMVGRGVRKAEGKQDCLVLDYSGNIRRHGPVDDVQPRVTGTTQVRECPKCGELCKKSALECPACGFQFPLPKIAEEPRERTIKHEARPEKDVSILSGRKPEDLAPIEWTVDAWAFAPWSSKNHGSPATLRVAYSCGYHAFFEWVCIEHPEGTYPRAKAVAWWREHMTAGGTVRGAHIDGAVVPRSLAEAKSWGGVLHMPARIKVRKEGQYFKVVGRTF